GYEALIIGLDGSRWPTERFPFAAPRLPVRGLEVRPACAAGPCAGKLACLRNTGRNAGRCCPQGVYPGSLCECFQEISSKAPPSGEVATCQRPPVDRTIESPIARP